MNQDLSDGLFAPRPPADDGQGGEQAASEASRPMTRRERRDAEEHQGHRRPGRKRHPLRSALIILIALALVGGAGYAALGGLSGMLPKIGFGSEAPADYEGPGSGAVDVVVREGQTATDIGQTLVKADVIASAQSFVNAANADPKAASAIQPGSYELREKMRAADAFAWLANKDNRTAAGVTVREGLWNSEIFALLAEQTDTPLADYKKAVSAGIGLPKEARGNAEGWLFPSTYQFEEDASAAAQLKVMVKRMVSELEKAGVPRDQWERTLTIASIIEGESGSSDRDKVARVILNRLDGGNSETNGRLEMDSTVHFIYQERGKAGTTDEQRASSSPYNTYKVKGLPPGPINSPGAAAIEAAENPASGDWLYFVTVNPDTGETKFATTFAQHQKNQKQFQTWCSENKDRC